MNYEILAVRYGVRTSRASEVFLNFHRYGVEDWDMDVAYYFWVIRGGERTILVDTGFSQEVADRRGRELLVTVPESLRRLDISPAEVDTVVVTHMHNDHAGNVGLFNDARIVLSQLEWDFWRGPIGERAQFAATVEANDLAMVAGVEAAGRLDLVAGTRSIAQGVDVMVVGGHTPGQLIVSIRSDGRLFILASDAVHYYEELERDWPFQIVSDLPRMYMTYDLLQSAAVEEQATIVPGHDPLVFERFPASGGGSNFAVTINAAHGT